jgi:hypothetical protein
VSIGSTRPQADDQDARPRSRHRVVQLAVVGLIAVAMYAGFGYSSKAHVTVKPKAPPSSGGFPAAVVGGFLSARMGGHWDTACSYFVPASAARSQCLQQAQSSDTGLAYKGAVTVDGQVVAGGRALVSVTGQTCVSDSRYKGLTRCVSNASAAAGMPGPSLSFSAAYAQATSKSDRSFSPWPCLRFEGHWYLAPVA